jgi:hypothetical protein
LAADENEIVEDRNAQCGTLLDFYPRLACCTVRLGNGKRESVHYSRIQSSDEKRVLPLSTEDLEHFGKKIESIRFFSHLNNHAVR